MKKNQDLTDALQRTADAMQKELSRSVLTIQTLGSYIYLSAALPLHAHNTAS